MASSPQQQHAPPPSTAQSPQPPLQQMQVQVPKPDVGPVDVVYLWVNGSDPVLHQELQEFQIAKERASTAAGNITINGSMQWSEEDALRQARFDAGRDELRYSLRSLDMYMPWYRHLFIVTNGQVPAWLRYSNPRVTIVPHSTIFKDPSHLPTFNSGAVQANIANIPGLSECFVLFDDDWFLTSSWTLRDFAGPDGAQVLTGSTLANSVKPGGNIYLQSTRYTAGVMEKHFGSWARYDPAHAPKFFQLRWLREMQSKLQAEVDQTSAARERSGTDLLTPPAYQWYVSQHQPGLHVTASDARTSFFSINEFIARPFVNAALADFRARVRSGQSDALQVDKARPGGPTAFYHEVRAAAAFEAEKAAIGRSGFEVSRCTIFNLYRLIATLSSPGSKMVCMNDDVSDELQDARGLINPFVRRYLEERYATPSQYEVLAGTDGCRHRLPKTSFGQLPTKADYAAACEDTPAPGVAPNPAAAPAPQAPRKALIQPGQHPAAHIDVA